MNTRTQIIFWSILGVCVIVFGWLLVFAALDGYTIIEKPLNFAETGQFGDFVGGVIGTILSAAGFVFLYFTLKEQRKALKEQSDNFSKERFESNFFDLIKIHRENVEQLKKRKVYRGEIATGRKVVKIILDEFFDCRNELKIFFNGKSENEIYIKDYADKLKRTISYTNPNIRLVDLAKMNITYCIIFLGVDADGKRSLERLFRGKYRSGFYNEIIQYIRLKPFNDKNAKSKWEELQTITNVYKRRKVAKGILNRRETSFESSIYTEEENQLIEKLWYKSDYESYYSGNQFRLGHYFRHLFGTVSFVHNNEFLKPAEKYNYIKILRAQFSTHEQKLIFLNSLSLLGMVWELTPKYKFDEGDDSQNSKEAKKNMLITEYQLIKNIPSDDIFGISVKYYYPNIKLESTESYLVPKKAEKQITNDNSNNSN